MQIYGSRHRGTRSDFADETSGLRQTRHGIGISVCTRPSKTGMGLPHESMVTLRDVLDILEIRISLETEAAWYAASRRSEEQIQLPSGRGPRANCKARPTINQHSRRCRAQFHLLIAQTTGNSYFVELLSQLRPHHHPTCTYQHRADFRRQTASVPHSV